MFGEIRLLSETLVASSNLAHKRSFTCVNPKVIEKVMPLSEEHAAVVVITFKNFDLAHCARILISVNSEFSRVWHSLINLD